MLMNYNIFEGAEENYRLIQPGMYEGIVNHLVLLTERGNEVIKFYVQYTNCDNLQKNIAVNYTFSDDSSSITTNELLELLYSFDTNFLGSNPYDTLNEISNNRAKLASLCRLLIGKIVTIEVTYKTTREGTAYKNIKLRKLVN